MRGRSWFLLSLLACGRVGSGLDDSDGGAPLPDVDPTRQSLSVSVTGDGLVRSTPPAIECGAACASDFPTATEVVLEAVPDPSTSFLGWTGDCSGTATCTVTMDGARTVGARFAPRGSNRWAVSLGREGSDDLSRLVVDGAGDVVVGGNGGTTNSDLTVTKLSSVDGTVIWSRVFATSPAGEALGGLAVDDSGDVYLAASVRGSVPAAYDDFTATGDEAGDVVVLKLDGADGHVIWGKDWGGAGKDLPTALVVAGDELFLAGGTASTPATFDELSLSGTTGDGFVLRARTSDGAALAAKLFADADDLFDLAVQGDELAIAGELTAPLSLGGACELAPKGTGGSALVMTLARTSLACQWGVTFGDTAPDREAAARAIAPFPGGGWVFGGEFAGRIQLAPLSATVPARGVRDAFVMRLDAAGGHVWSFRFGGDASDAATGVTVTARGEVAISGVFDESIELGALALTGRDNTFVARFDAAVPPLPEWAVTLGGDGPDFNRELALGTDGTVYVLSTFNGATNVGGTSLSALGVDGWIAALVP
jgi:Divergent InlB B-repeat domain